MSEEQTAPETIEQVQITLLAEDTAEVRAQKSWSILGGQGQVNPTFQKIFDVYQALDKQAWDAAQDTKPAQELMVG